MTEDRLILSRAEDALYLAEKNYQIKTVGFLNPHERSVLLKNIHKSADVQTFFEGGYADAERTLFIAKPEFIEFDINQVICVVKVFGRDLETLTHRDYLGSLMGLGIKRENIGDILVNDTGAFIFTKCEIAQYIIANLEKIGRHGVKTQICSVESPDIPEPKTKEIVGTVSSLRLDAVVSQGTGLARGKAQDIIKDGLVSLNWENIDTISKEIENGDLISVRGFGRMRVSEIGGLTRKGRTFIKILKYE